MKKTTLYNRDRRLKGESAKRDDSRIPLGTRRCCDVESTSLTLIQRRNNVVYPVGGNLFH